MTGLNLKAPEAYERAIIERPIGALKPYARNARTHSKKQL